MAVRGKVTVKIFHPGGFVLVAGLLALTACGQTGPLYLPDEARGIVTRPAQPAPPEPGADAPNSPRSPDSPVEPPSPAPEVTAPPEKSEADENAKKPGTAPKP
jgi:predicted small lipoprotein YifL